MNSPPPLGEHAAPRGRAPLGSKRLLLGGSAAVLLVAVLVSLVGGGGPAPAPLPGIGRPARSGDPFAYSPERESEFAARAVAGSAHVLFAKSPGGAIATASRVARLRPAVDAAAAGGGVDPNVLEGIVFVESAGRTDVIAGSDLSAAAGLTQILASTGQALLGMQIDLARSTRLTAAIGRAAAQGNAAAVTRLERQRAAADDRFNPPKALAATVRYLRLAQARFGGRSDLALESYHMGIGNLQRVLDAYDGGGAVPYTQLFFDTAPDHHGDAYRLLSGFGDDSWLYYWRVQGAMQIMRLFRGDRAALARLNALQVAGDSNAYVLTPPDSVHPFSDPDAVSAAYANHTLVPLPRNAAALGLFYERSLGLYASKVGAPASLYRGLRTPALDLLIELAARVRAISGRTPLRVAGTVTDGQYQRALGVPDTLAATGFSFQIARSYVAPAQAEAFQAMLDRLQALDLIAWVRTPATIEITVAPDAASVIADGV